MAGRMQYQRGALGSTKTCGGWAASCVCVCVCVCVCACAGVRACVCVCDVFMLGLICFSICTFPVECGEYFFLTLIYSLQYIYIFIYIIYIIIKIIILYYYIFILYIYFATADTIASSVPFFKHTLRRWVVLCILRTQAVFPSLNH